MDAGRAALRRPQRQPSGPQGSRRHRADRQRARLRQPRRGALLQASLLASAQRAADRIDEGPAQGAATLPPPAALDRVRLGARLDVAGGAWNLAAAERAADERRVGEASVDDRGERVKDLEQAAGPAVVDFALGRLDAGLDAGRDLLRREDGRDRPDAAAGVVAAVLEDRRVDRLGG